MMNLMNEKPVTALLVLVSFLAIIVGCGLTVYDNSSVYNEPTTMERMQENWK
jgi:FtsH-binding integral membrane protein